MTSAKLRIDHLATRIGALYGWRRLLLALILGAVSALAMPPFYAMPILWVIYPVLLWQMNGAANHRQAFLLGWTFGFGQFAAGFYWICISMFTDIAHWWWAVPFACTILPALFAFNPGFGAMLWWRARPSGLRSILLFAAWMSIAEWTRGHLFTGFPWNLTAHGWIDFLPLLQSYSILGGYGLSFITIAIVSLPSLLGVHDYPTKKATAFSIGGLAILALLALWGWQRIPSQPTASVPDTIVRLVQPNVPEGEKQNQGADDTRFKTLLAMSMQKTSATAPRIIVWPETAIPYSYMPDLSPQIPRVIASVLPRGNTGFVLAGTVRRERGSDGYWKYYNSLQGIDGQGHIIGHYDKTHLVPYGEYMPFRSLLHLNAIAVGPDLTAGSGPVTITAPGLPPFSSFICYEAVFPERVVAPASIDQEGRPQWLLQITNDAWFGDSSGPYQHFAMARARAVEQGLPLLRAANTGISGAVDPYGRILASLPIGVRGVLDVALPQGLPSTPFYGRYGDLLFLLMLIVTLALTTPLLQRQVGKNFLKKS